MATIEFTQNVQDLSTDRGFQFKFFCERCGSGHMSAYRINKLGAAGGLLEAAGGLLGGLFSKVADTTYQVQRAVGGKGHDDAMRDAVEEIRPLFVQCRRCANWMCREACFNEKAQMCRECAPIAEHEEVALRAQHVQQKVANDLIAEEERRIEVKKAELAKPCPDCGTETLGAKFCPGCGKPTGAAKANCTGCGAKLTPGAKFCGECGEKV